MKDPLQREETPYEILGLPRDAQGDEIERAFRQRFVNRGKVDKLTSAKRALQRPVDRALIDLFYYDPDVLGRLDPSPLQNPMLLEVPQRAQTAAAWSKQLRVRFPDIGAAHSLGVLWYWWAMSEEELASHGGSPATAANEFWPQAIAHWAMLLHTTEFWDKQPRIARDAVDAVRAEVVTRLRGRLHDIGQRYQAAGDSVATARYRELELALSAELRTAEEFTGTTLRTTYGRISCGRFMLREIGILETIQQKVAAELQKSPENRKLRALLDHLSSYAPIITLLDQKKPAAALAAIAALPAGEEDLPEIIELHTRALHYRARELASLDNIREALTIWDEALQISPTFEMDAEIEAEVVEACHRRAVFLQVRQRDEAIDLLEWGLLVVEDIKLQLTLAELLVQRGVEAIVIVQKSLSSESVATPEVIATVERSVSDIERAATLGSERAKEQAPMARAVLNHVTAESSIPAAVRLTHREAQRAISEERFDDAVPLMRQAIEASPKEGRAALEEELAQLLNARGVRRLNAFQEAAVKGSAKRPSPEIGLAVFLNSGGGPPKGGWVGMAAEFVLSLWYLFTLAAAYLFQGHSPYRWVIPVIVIVALLIKGAIALAEWSTKSMLSVAGRQCFKCSSRAEYQVDAGRMLNAEGRAHLKKGTVVPDELHLCSTHASELRDLIDTRPRLDAGTIARLTAGITDLEEASRLAPSSEQIRDNLRQAREIRANVREAA